MLKAEKIELLEDEITELGFVIREKNVDIRSLKLKLHKLTTWLEKPLKMTAK